MLGAAEREEMAARGTNRVVMLGTVAQEIGSRMKIPANSDDEDAVPEEERKEEDYSSTLLLLFG